MSLVLPKCRLYHDEGIAGAEKRKITRQRQKKEAIDVGSTRTEETLKREALVLRMREAASVMNYSYCVADHTCARSLSELEKCWNTWSDTSLLHVKNPDHDPCINLRRVVERCAGRFTSRTAARMGVFGDLEWDN